MSSRRLSAAGVIFAACVLAYGAAAQDVGPPPPATPPDTQPATQPSEPSAAATPRNDRLLDIEFLQLQLGFEGSYDQRGSVWQEFGRFGAPPRYQRQYNRAYHFEETLGLETSGALFDEKIALFDVGMLGGFSQEWFAEAAPGPDRTERPHGDLFEYDLSFDLLPRGKISGTAFAQRLDSRVPRAFQPSLDRTLERYGAGLFFNDRKLPMRLTFEHTWDELTSRTWELEDDERRGRDNLRYEATWQIDRNHALRLDYEYDDRHEQYSGADTRFDTTRHYATLNHTLRFGLDNRSAWETLLRLQDEDGDLARDNSEASSRLRLQWTDDLSTNFAAQYIKDSYEQLTTETVRGEAGVTHQLGKTLTTTLQMYGLQQQADENADFSEWGTLANLNFNHDNRLGRLSANLSYNHASSDTRNGDRRGIVVGESVTLRDPLVTFLAQPYVDLGTIVITNGERTRTYLTGRDYIAYQIGQYTAIKRLPTGEIVDGATVLVNYTYQVFGDYDICRDRIDFRVQQAFKFGLTPYYAFSIQDEDLDNSDFVRWRARNVNRHRIGTTYRQKRWSAGVEYEYHDDAIDPYQAVHLNGDTVLVRGLQHQLDGKTTVSRFWFDGSGDLEPRNTTLLDLGLSYRYLLARNLEANATASYRFEDDTLFGQTHGVDLTTALEWRIGYFALRFEAEYDMLDLPGSRDDGMSFWVKLKRDIPVIAKRPP